MGLDALLAPALDGLFARPSRIGVASAWHGHVPFARWLVRASRPRTFIELGTQGGVSYAAFCDGVLAEGLDARCHAVDTWEGDTHAGFYDRAVFESWRAFHDARYGGFSSLLRCTFDEALCFVADDSLDLLHIDGRHRYEDVTHIFQSWRAKLSRRAVVLFHDTNVRERDFGVWRFWAEQAARHPSFEFLHAHGLGVLCVGEEPPDLVRRLCGLRDPHEIGLVRDRFALVGERWAIDFDLATERRARIAGETAATSAEIRLRALEGAMATDRSYAFAVAEARNRIAVMEQDAAATERDAVTMRQQAAAMRQGAAAREAALVQARDRITALEQDVAAIEVRLGAEKAAHAASRSRADTAEDAAREIAARLADADRGVVAALAEVQRAQATVAALTGEKTAVEKSLSWRMTRPLRWGNGLLRPRPQPTEQPVAAPASAPTVEAAPPSEVTPPSSPTEPSYLATEPESAAPAAPAEKPEAEAAVAIPQPAAPDDRRPRILFVSGEPTTPGHHYRVLHAMQLAAALGWRADWSEVAPVGPHTLAGARIVVLWRVPWSPHVQGILDASAEIGARVLFDIDDLVFKPELARVEVIDGIRTTDTSESAISSFFAMVNRALDKCELTLCTTEELAWHVRSIGHTAVVLPNGFDEPTHARARLAARARRAEHDGLVRIGYAGGSRTHQRDFRLIAAPLAAVLRARSDARLTLFRDPRGGEGVVLLHEFPDLADLAAQVEWRDMVALPDLPAEMARFDLNLAPLEAGNVFCEAKSELKYFEAALVDVPSVASPAGPMARAVRHGETGFLVATEQEWHDTLLRLVDDPPLRRVVARNAYHDVLWRFGPRRRRELLLALLRDLDGGADGARAFELALRRGDHRGPGLPHIPEAETLFESDAFGEAEVTVTIPVYNYADYVLDALESVATQTLDVIDLVVIDDASTDDSAALVLEWARHHVNRFNRFVVRRHVTNAGLGFARNSGFAAAETPFVLPLDADNRLHAGCAAALAERLRTSDAAFVYPSQRQFGGKDAVFGDVPYTATRLVTGNYIDAMALVAKWAWAAAGGYDHVRFGWEDYDLWCRLAELGFGGEHVPEVLADYRVHTGSMLARSTDVPGNKQALIADMHCRHPWLRIPRPS